MQMLYDSDNFIVVAHQQVEADEESGTPEKIGYELVDKRSNKTMYLQDSWAMAFYAQIMAWQEETPEQSEVEQTLDSYTSLATVPLVMH